MNPPWVNAPKRVVCRRLGSDFHSGATVPESHRLPDLCIVSPTLRESVIACQREGRPHVTRSHLLVTMRLTFVSHAPTEFTRRAAFPTDGPIEPIHSRDPLGRITAVYGGPELRCVQTGQLFGLECAPDKALRDWDYGRWAGRTLDEINLTDPTD